MVERICPACHHANPLDDRYCGFCGNALREEALMRRADAAQLPVLHRLPAEQLRQVGTAVALGAAALAAEVGLAWLKRRAALPGTAVPTAPARTVRTTATILSQRITETWERGELVRQVIERQIWRRDEQ